MANISWLKLTISGVVGILIGIVITALINLFFPMTATLIPTVLAVCFSSALSAVTACFIGARQKKAGQEKVNAS